MLHEQIDGTSINIGGISFDRFLGQTLVLELLLISVVYGSSQYITK